MDNNFCVLFDMDGVLLDTESQYSMFWKHIGDKYNLGIDKFEQKIKGTTLFNILGNYFSHCTENQRQEIKQMLIDFEEQMPFEEITGALSFVNELRQNRIKVGMVTSSDDIKLSLVYKQNDLRPLFDTIVSANRIVEGKPNPMCYLLAAKDLGYEPKDCFVFEDAFTGIDAGRAAGMRVIGLSTTNDASLLQDKCELVIPDFENFTLNNLKCLR